MNTLTIDFSRTIGKMKPLHGVNNSPVTFGNTLPEFAEAGIPYVRTHDTAGAFGGAHFIDIPNIFPDFQADPDDPASYDFAFTDAYLKGLTASGCQIFYRLGVTIENNWQIKAYRIHPPEDASKWARICAGVIRHYNEGWANGFHYGIEYWEIWNEPENPPLWSGSREEFFELYRVAATFLKQEFPQVKIGGYGCCGFYALTNPGMSDFFKGFLTWFEEFLRFVSQNRIPLDFFTWHLYNSNLDELQTHAEYVTAQLRKYGLEQVENIFDEWNYTSGPPDELFDRMKEMPGAIFVAGAFCRMQNSVVDKAMYYDALPNRRYCGLYYFPSLKVTKTYYAFKAFNELYQLGNQVYCSIPPSGKLSVLAAGNAGEGAVMLVNHGTRKQEIRLQLSPGHIVVETLLLDRKHELTPTAGYYSAGQIILPAGSITLLKCNCGKPAEKRRTPIVTATPLSNTGHAGLQDLTRTTN